MKKQLTQIDTIIYQSKSGALELKTDKEHETIWLTQEQMASLFDVQKAAISKHLKNIFNSEELYEKSAVSILETTAKDKNHGVASPPPAIFCRIMGSHLLRLLFFVNYYSLDFNSLKYLAFWVMCFMINSASFN